MKKLLTIFFALLIVTVAACSSGNGEDESKLVLYTATAQDNLDVLIPAFEEEYGIEVEVVTAGTGEIYSRIQAEANNPYADVAWLGEFWIVSDTDYFEEYVSPEDEFMGDYKNTTGFATNIEYNVPVILYNKNLVDFEITGYEDLLHPDLFGKIAMGNAAASSSAYNHLENMLLAMGNGDLFDEAGWDYVEAFYNQLDGRIVDSSGTIHRGVVDGEYAVGMTWESPAQTYLAEGIDNIGVVFMDEGVVPKTSAVGIVKDAKNMENAKLFVDFMASEYGQSLLGTEVTGANPVRPGVEISDYKVDINEQNTIQITSEWSADQQPDVLERFTDLYERIFE